MNRRDFLKLLALLPALAATRGVDRVLAGSTSDAPGVIVLVLDALSALNLSLYGYPRKTSPHIERFAARSTVYHAHYSAANFTSSGTASLLTGLYPWTHRAFHYEGLIAADKVDANVFRYWGEDAFRLGFTQNAWADLLLYQFAPWLESHLDLRAFSIDKRPIYTSLLQHDPIAAHKALDSFALELEPGLGAASLLTLARKLSLYRGKRDVERTLTEEYPLGIPQTLNDLDTYFLLENLFDGLMDLTASLEANSFAYLHLFPPHYPYAPRTEFLEAMQDGWRAPVKRQAPFRTSVSAEEEEGIQKSRDKYDAYIATVDEDFGRLFDFWEREGVLDRNYVVITSDHGEIYERGVLGHTNEYLYEPLIRVPLIVSSPGQTARVDVHTPTNSVDLVPTLVAVSTKLIEGSP